MVTPGATRTPHIAHGASPRATCVSERSEACVPTAAAEAGEVEVLVPLRVGRPFPVHEPVDVSEGCLAHAVVHARAELRVGQDAQHGLAAVCFVVALLHLVPKLTP